MAKKVKKLRIGPEEPTIAYESRTMRCECSGLLYCNRYFETSGYTYRRMINGGWTKPDRGRYRYVDKATLEKMARVKGFVLIENRCPNHKAEMERGDFVFNVKIGSHITLVAVSSYVSEDRV